MNINHTQIEESDGSAYWLAQLCTSPKNEALVQSIEKWYQMVTGSVYLHYTFSILKISLEKEAAMYTVSEVFSS